MTNPVIGICAVRERAHWALWDQEAHLVADSYVAPVQRAGGLAVLLGVDTRAPLELLDRVDGLLLIGGSDIDPATYGACETRPLSRCIPTGIGSIHAARKSCGAEAMAARSRAARKPCGAGRVAGSANVEAGEALGLLFAHVDAVDLGVTRPGLRELDQAAHVVPPAFEHGFDGAIGAIARPAGDAVRAGALPERVAERHTLDAAVDRDAAADPIVCHASD